ncbi:MAG: NUDIX domain-containing protein [Ruminococcaceae bacterium]|nr:NUDIX domain-containing protein [Oscillospiraceae bacterium]
MTTVAAALIWDGQKFMICQRPPEKKRGLLWEFVGGKLEPGETAEQALIRECQEELGVIVTVKELFMEVIHEYPDITVCLKLFHAAIAEGTPQKLEHVDIRWITPAEIPQYDFCPADQEILERIIAMDAINTVYDFLKNCQTYYLATVDHDQPRVRPFGTIDLFDGALYIQTGKKKEVSRQLHANPQIELCAFDSSRWLRLSATVQEDDRIEAQQHMLDAYPHLKSMYLPGDGNTEVFRLAHVTAVFSSFTEAPQTLCF